MRPAAAIGLVLFLAAGILFFGMQSGGSGAKEITKPFLRDAKALQDALQEARALSEDSLTRFSRGEDLSSADRDKLTKAGALFEGILDYEPGALNPYLGAGMTYRALGANDKAEKFLVGAVMNGENKTDQESLLSVAEAHYNLSLLYFDTHHYDASLREASEAIRIVPKSANYLSARAQAYVQLNDRHRAIDDLRWALKLDPKNKRALGLHKLLVTAMTR